MEQKVLQAIKRYSLFSPGDRVIVAVSGGPDSLCLLHLLAGLAPALGISLHVVHVNHGLRPEAGQEALFVKKQAARLGLPVTVCRVDVNKVKRRGGYSLQDAARQARYRCLQEVARHSSANCIVTAHHLDDRVETLLLRLLCGSGLDGLAGMRPKRLLAPGIVLLRPFYHVSREEIISYCRIHKLTPVQDRSNLSLRYLRNRVRLRLLPFLETEFGLHVRRSLATTCDLLAEDGMFLHGLAKDEFARAVLAREADRLTLDAAELKLLPQALKSRLVLMAMWEAGVKRPALAHVNSVLSLLNGPPSGRVFLPGGVTAAREYSLLHIGRLKDSLRTGAGEVTLKVPGSTVLPWSGQVISAEVLPVGLVRLPSAHRNEAFLDLDRLELPLTARPWRPGDRMWPLGARGSRKIKKILIDKKIPAAVRNTLTLVVSGGKIAWIGGVEISEYFKITALTRQVLRLHLLGNNREKDENND